MPNSNQILRTKLHRPPITHDLVIRTKLIKELKKNRQKSFTFVSALAGYGKSIFVSQWLEEIAIKTTWVSLDDEHNNFSTFLTFLAERHNAIHNAILKELSTFLKVSELPPLKTIASCLINELDAIDEEFVVVFDDYHMVHQKA